MSLVILEGNIVGDRPASPWTPSYSVTSQGPGISQLQSGTHQEDINQLEQFSGYVSIREEVSLAATDDIDDVSISSRVPEPPCSPQSELGIFTPGFDTRSEVSAASREPASPTSSRTDLMSLSTSTDDAEEFTIPASIRILVLPALAVEQYDSTLESTPLATAKDVPDSVAEEILPASAPLQTTKPVSEEVDSPTAPQMFPGSSDLLAAEPTRTIQEKLVNFHLSIVMCQLILVHLGHHYCA